MDELKSLVAKFLKGEASFDALNAALGECLTRAPEQAAEVKAVLDSARKRGLPSKIYAALERRLAPLIDETVVAAHVADRTAPTEAPRGDDKSLVLEEQNRSDTAAPVPGTVADNAARLARDRAATEHTLMAYLGRQGDTTTASLTATGDIFSQPFTEDEIAAADITATPASESAPGASGPSEIGPGYMLRGRFQLTKKLGEGGMGEVWRARDMLKVRARDRNPYVAIKLLGGDFREHPEAFVALQRETSKQQRLAHPNVATVFNFDRDRETGTDFMTMEVMEGESMDKVMRKLPAEGLSFDEAMPIIEQIGAGLSYAHQNGLVHSDLKPGNCFLTSYGVVKLLDFGIARASKTESHAEGDKTLFDPGELGAITPTYAATEMFEGMDPDPRDDIYALAVMAYQLFTGKHPFAKQNAVKAMSLGLEPPHVAKLTKRQNRGLAHGLAFRREQRTESVEKFLEDLRPAKKQARAYAAAAAVALVIIGVMAINPLMDLIRARENAAIIEQLAGGTRAHLQTAIARISELDHEGQQRNVLNDPRTLTALASAVSRAEGEDLDAVLELIAGLDAGWRQNFLGIGAVRKAVLENFQSRINLAFDPASGRHDFVTASALARRLDALYPSSASVLTLTTALNEKRDRRAQALEDEFEHLIERSPLVSADGERTLSDVVEEIRGLDPLHALLRDERLAARLVSSTEALIEAGDVAAARRYVDWGAAYAGQDETLAPLKVQIQTLKARLDLKKLELDIAARLEAQSPRLTSTEAFRSVSRELITLSVVNPDNPQAASLGQRHRELFDRDFQGLVEQQRVNDAAKLLALNGPMLDSAALDARRDQLSRLTNASGAQPLLESPDNYDHELETLRLHIETADFTVEWFTTALIGIRALAAVLPPGDPRLNHQRGEILELMLARVDDATAGRQFEAGEFWLTRAQMISPGSERVARARAAMDSESEAIRRKYEQERILVELEGLREEFTAAAPDGTPRQRHDVLERMRALTKTDPEIAEIQAPFLNRGYAEVADAYARAGDFEAAARAASEGLDAVGDSADLTQALAGYRNMLEAQSTLAAVRNQVENPAVIDVEAVRRDLEFLNARFPGETSAIRSDLTARGSAGIASYLSSPELDPRIAVRGIDALLRLFPESADALRRSVSASAVARIERTRRHDPRAARALLDAMTRVLPEDAGLADAARTLPPAAILAARDLIAGGRLTAAAATLNAAEARIRGHEDYATLNRTLASRQQRAREKFERFVAQVKSGVLPDRASRLAAFEEVKALWSDNPQFDPVDYVNLAPGRCLTALAGQGRRSTGTCYDQLADGSRGPVMVVVPALSAGAPPFAIGKYEVSVKEFNRMCSATGYCEPRVADNDKLPVTNVTLADAERYARWLTDQATSKAKRTIVYRLPRSGEWQHAATANGNAPRRGINCRPQSGSTLSAGLFRANDGTLTLGMPIGRSLVSTGFGEQNGFGVVNAVGNAQEFALSGSKLVAKGGAFDDPATRCGVQSERVHDGSADAVTGFRLVRELD